MHATTPRLRGALGEAPGRGGTSSPRWADPILPPGMIDEVEPNKINGLLRRCISKCKTFPKEGANVSDGIFVHEESPLEKPKCIYHENRERNDQGVEARPRRIDRTTKKRSVALKQLIEIIDQFQDKLIAWNDQGNENNGSL